MSSQIYKKKEFDAYHVLCQKGNWYVIGFDHGASDIRIYAMARIKNILLNSDSFKILPDFKLEEHVDLDFGVWNNTQAPEEYEFLFSPSLSNYITERQWHKTQKIEIKDDGSVLLKFKSNQKEMILAWVMGFGSAVTVIKPESMIQKIVEENKTVMEKYKNR